MRPKRLVDVLKATGAGWIDDNAFRLSGALAYYTIFSIAPLLVIVIAVAGLLFGRDAAQHQLAAQLTQLLGPTGAATAEQLLARAYHPHGGVVATIAGLAALFLGATAVFSELQDALNTIWRVRTKPGRTVRKLIRDRVFSFAMVLCLGFLLLVSLVLGAVTQALGGFASHVLPGSLSTIALEAGHLVVGFGVNAVLFALIFKVLPDVELRLRDVAVGGAVTAALFSVGRVLIGIYLGRAGVGSPFGAASSVVVLLGWVYYSSLILYLGAEFTRAYVRARGIEPAVSPNAERMDPTVTQTSSDRDATRAHGEWTPDATP